jgi:hypothetical protein
MKARLGLVAYTLGIALACVAARAKAQDAGVPGSSIVKQFQQNLQLVPDKAKKVPAVDPRVLSWLVSKMTVCYQAEVGRVLRADDRALLAEFAPELALQFREAFRSAGCQLVQAESPACMTALDQLDCEPFAKVVRSSGWDRAPSPEMEAAIAKYTQQLAVRYLGCRSGVTYDEEEVRVRAEHTAHSAALQISLSLTTGQCTLAMEKLDRCLENVAATDACPGINERAKQSQLPRFCDEFVDCSAEPALVGKVAQ